MILMTEKEFVDFATVRELLSDARERRGDLSYEQIMALQHAEWAASTNRGVLRLILRYLLHFTMHYLKMKNYLNTQKSVQS